MKNVYEEPKLEIINFNVEENLMSDISGDDGDSDFPGITLPASALEGLSE